MMMSFTPLPPLIPHLAYSLPREDSDKYPSHPITSSISPSHNQNQRHRNNSQDNKFTSDLDNEELALQERVTSLLKLQGL